MQNPEPFYRNMTCFCKICRNSCLLFFLTSALHNITTSQRILKFEFSIIFFYFFENWKDNPRGGGGGPTGGKVVRLPVAPLISRIWCATDNLWPFAIVRGHTYRREPSIRQPVGGTVATARNGGKRWREKIAEKKIQANGGENNRRKD